MDFGVELVATENLMNNTKRVDKLTYVKDCMPGTILSAIYGYTSTFYSWRKLYFYHSYLTHEETLLVPTWLVYRCMLRSWHLNPSWSVNFLACCTIREGSRMKEKNCIMWCLQGNQYLSVEEENIHRHQKDIAG